MVVVILARLLNVAVEQIIHRVALSVDTATVKDKTLRLQRVNTRIGCM